MLENVFFTSLSFLRLLRRDNDAEFLLEDERERGGEGSPSLSARYIVLERNEYKNITH